jgi:hypothetical protein
LHGNITTSVDPARNKAVELIARTVMGDWIGGEYQIFGPDYTICRENDEQGGI